MAEAKKPKRRLKKPAETVRQKAVKANTPKKPRRIRSAGSKAAKPFKALGRLIVRLIKPFGFVLKPFKTKPMRFVGRILYKVLLINYFKESWAELRQVTWPNRKQTTQLSIAVFIFATFFSLTVAAVDAGLDKVFEKLIIK